MEKSREAKELAKEQAKKEKQEAVEKQTTEEFQAKKSKTGPGRYASYRLTSYI